MSLTRQHELDLHRRPVFRRNDRPAASALFGRSCRLLGAAQDLEREAAMGRETNGTYVSR